MFRYFFNIVTIVFIPFHLYTGIRLWQALRFNFPSLKRIYYWLVFAILSSSFILTRIAGRNLPDSIDNLLSTFGYCWIVAMLYLTLILLLLDICQLFAKLGGFCPSLNTLFQTRLAAVILVILVILYGSWSARTPQITRYEIIIPKAAGELKQLKVVMISDLHLGKTIGNKRLNKMVYKVNELNPDLILIPGDIIQDSQPFLENKMALEFQKLRPPLGVFASLGNHEFYGGVVKDTVSLLEQGGLKVIRDSYIKIADSFYLVGKDDPAAGRGSNTLRPELNKIMEGVDISLPVILLYHQPTGMEEAREAGVDLQLSGHTHSGQVFPANLITSRLFEEDWGYLKKDTLQLIVSCGIGTWGPDLRIGSKSEIVEILIKFDSR